MKGRQMLTKDEILKANDIVFKEIDVPEWGGKVRVKCMTGEERDKFESEIYDVKGKDVKLNRDNFRAKLLGKTLVDENGKRLFSDNEIKLLGQKAAKPLDAIFTVAQKLNALSQADQDELTKN